MLWTRGEDEVEAVDNIFGKIADGESDIVIEFIKQHPDQINDTDAEGRT